jgi:hypothetical protein
MSMFKRGCLVLLLILASACGSSDTAPTPTCQDRTARNFSGPLPCTYPPACEVNHTGTLVLVNNAAPLTPRDVYLDGGFIGTLPYGSQFTREVAAGVAHSVKFVSSITGVVVSTAQPIVNQCSTSTLSNTFSVGRAE